MRCLSWPEAGPRRPLLRPQPDRHDYSQLPLGKRLDAVHRLRIFVVWTVIGSSLGLGPRELRSTNAEIGARSFAELMPHNLTLPVHGPDGKPVPKAIVPSDLPPIRELVDALLYLGPDAGEVEAPAEVYRDPAYVAQLRERAAILEEMLGFEPWDVEAEIARARR